MPTIAYWITWVIDWAGTAAGLYAFIHAVTQRKDAYTAGDRKTKPVWAGITAGATVAMWLFTFMGIGLIFWVAGIVATLVYLVDVRPKLIEVQKGRRNW